MYTIGIDIGGTKIHGIAVQGTRIIGRVHLLHGKKTADGAVEVLYRIVEAFQRQEGLGNLKALGIAVPAPLNVKRGALFSPPNFPALKGIRLQDLFQRKLRVPVKVENDGRCFVLGASAPGLPTSKVAVTVGITIGTGLGGGIRYGSYLWQGAHGTAGEIGHTVIVPDGPKCPCGQNGCLEMYVSEKFLLREGRREPKELEDAAYKKNKKALALYEKLGWYLGLGIANIVNTIDPNAIIIGGSIAKASPLFLDAARKTASQHIISPLARKIPILVARNIDDAGALGATMLFQDKSVTK